MVREPIVKNYFRLDLPAHFNIHPIIHVIHRTIHLEQSDEIPVLVTRVSELLEGQWSVARYPQKSRRTAPFISSTAALVQYMQILARSLKIELLIRE